MEHRIVPWKVPFILLTLLGVLEVAVVCFHWRAIPHFDVFMHLLGGMTVGLFIVRLFRFDRTMPAVLFVLFCGVAIGIAWEMFEYVIDTAGILSVPMSAFESLKDVAVGSIGAVCATFFTKNP